MSKTVEPENSFDIWSFLQSLRNDCLQSQNFVIGYANLLKQDNLDNEQRENIEMVEMYAYRSVEIIQKYVAGGFAFYVQREKPFYKADLKETIESAVRRLNRAYGIHQISVTFPEILPPISTCGFLDTVFINLRCFQATERMEIRSELNDGETAVYVQIQMPPQKYLPDYPGSDLDLARKILKHHNSELKIQEEKDKTTFNFTLSLWQGE
jgi:light-regulated signal transduction histidine kinase (bacteriophytochrome)